MPYAIIIKIRRWDVSVTGDFLKNIGTYLFGILLLSFLFDVIKSSTWDKRYFTTGLPLFEKHITVVMGTGIFPLVSQFENRFQSTWSSSLVFREIEPKLLGFREKFFEVRLASYLPVMHGV